MTRRSPRLAALGGLLCLALAGGASAPQTAPAAEPMATTLRAADPPRALPRVLAGAPRAGVTAPPLDAARVDSLPAPGPQAVTSVTVQIPFQGYLTNGGTPVSGTLVTVATALYGAPSGGTALYTENFTNVPATDGVFTLVLGSSTGASLSAGLFSGAPLYLGLSVNGEAELPRTQLLASPFAIRAAEADHAASADAVVSGAWSQTGGNVYRLTGLVGIGTNAPTKSLDVAGDTRLTSNSDVNNTLGSGALSIRNNPPTEGLHLDTNEIQTIGRDLLINNDNVQGTILNNNLFSTATGNVGIGQTTPTKKLDVTGDMRLVSNSDLGTTIGTGILNLQNVAANAAMMLDQNEIQVVGDDLYLNNNNVSNTHVNNLAHFTTGGRVGLNTLAPEGKIGIENQGGTDGQVLLNFSEDENAEFYFRSGFLGTGATGNSLGLGTFWTSGAQMLWQGDGKVGVGRQSGLTARLDVLHSGSGLSDCAGKFENSAANGIALDAKCTSSDAVAVLEQFGTGDMLRGFNGGGSPVLRVTQTGRVITPVLEITGGSDLVEPFETGDESPAPGTVLTIDPAHPGHLATSRTAYDRRVAGVVSGAGGVEPGIRMSQAGTLGGDTPVAMTGRVYVRCTAENGAIEPGDLLTTAGTPGCAMKVTDHDRALGCVLGKAMGSLADGNGLVLVLVNLQ